MSTTDKDDKSCEKSFGDGFACDKFLDEMNCGAPAPQPSTSMTPGDDSSSVTRLKLRPHAASRFSSRAGASAWVCLGGRRPSASRSFVDDDLVWHGAFAHHACFGKALCQKMSMLTIADHILLLCSSPKLPSFHHRLPRRSLLFAS